MTVKALARSYINGQWVPTSDHGSVDVIDPATEQVLSTVAVASKAEIEASIAAARGALLEWSTTPLARRAELLTEVARRLEARGDDLARTMTSDVGTPISDSKRLQVEPAIHTFSATAQFLGSVASETLIDKSIVTRESLGVVACITPWNYPLYQMATKVAPALAAGCTVVAKPSIVAPLGPVILAEAIHDAGVPAGVFNLVLGTGAAAGQAIVEHPGIDAVSFTGSTEMGRQVAAAAAGTVKHLALELGGKSPSLLLEDGPVEHAVVGTMAKCFQNTGQTCAALTRLLVPRRHLNRVEEIASECTLLYPPGNPQEPETRLGPVVSASQRDSVRAYIKLGGTEGARLIAGGYAPPANLAHGYFVKPTVFSQVSPDMAIAREEIFGPVLVIIPFDDEDQAIQIANSSEYGLSAAVWSADEERAVGVARRIRSGGVSINGARTNPDAPFGGFKQSGYGRERGAFGIEGFLTTKSIHR